MPEGITCW